MSTEINVPHSDASVAPIITALEGIYDSLNKRFFNSALLKPTIALSQKGTKIATVYGWFTPMKVWVQTRDGQNVDRHHEINICPEHLNRPPEEICETLLHEMVHLFNAMNGSQDCSSNGQYHNRRFKTSAEAHGLIAEKNRNYGYSNTSLKPETIEFIKGLDLAAFVLHRDSGQTNGAEVAPAAPTEKKTSSTRKYICPKCGTSIRATKKVRVRCDICDVLFKECGPQAKDAHEKMIFPVIYND